MARTRQQFICFLTFYVCILSTNHSSQHISNLFRHHYKLQTSTFMLFFICQFTFIVKKKSKMKEETQLIWNCLIELCDYACLKFPRSFIGHQGNKIFNLTSFSTMIHGLNTVLTLLGYWFRDVEIVFRNQQISPPTIMWFLIQPPKFKTKQFHPSTIRHFQCYPSIHVS